jgi:hypothetical protein
MAARYVLVPNDDPAPPAVPGVRVRRFRLARVGVSPRSALGYDRHERLERVADKERGLGPSASGFR